MAGDEALVTCRCYNCTQTNSGCIYKWFFEEYRERFVTDTEWTDVGRWSWQMFDVCVDWQVEKRFW